MTEQTAPSSEKLPERSRIVQEHVRAAGLASLVRELPDSARTAVEAAAALGCEVGAIGSSLLFLADGDPLLVMTSGRHRVDLEVLAASVGAVEVAMAPVSVVREVTGQAIGGVAPVGHPAPVRTVVDVALRDYDVVWTAGGTPHTVMPMTFDELVALTGAPVIAVAAD
ncbi:YbaK/EbsC family protein [Microbacterium capsulatum]|uniref:YbaK/EbsC family protein n=1 Tax=Microbacterium capsulatum TaxID=3041921 RepID=A0ABU0XBZ4_9MICO|nr:YbaK/EbsC family protein [Microbacterium sp. ASV81]MDQ4212593.1 YbaK/EbsC family protein [Microbacterium sp. ASV81]